MTISYQELTEALRQEAAALARLQQTLDEEHQALSGHDVEALDATTAAKAECIGEVERHGTARLEFLKAAGFEATEAGMEACLAEAPQTQGEALQKQWQGLKDLFSDCQEQNRVNGRLLGARMDQTRRGLSILRGEGPTEKELYGQDGTTTSASGSRSYAKV